MPSRTKAQSEFSKELKLLMLHDAFPVKESKEADDAVMDQDTVEGVVVGRTAARSLPDSFSDKVLWGAGDAFTVQGGTREGVKVVDVPRSLSDVYPVKGSSWLASVRLQGKGHNPTVIKRANFPSAHPSIVGILRRWHASVS